MPREHSPPRRAVFVVSEASGPARLFFRPRTRPTNPASLGRLKRRQFVIWIRNR